MPDLQADLLAAGIHVLGAIGCDNLVQEAVRKAPDVVVCWVPQSGEALLRALQALRDTDPRPVLVFTQDVQAETMERALDAGVHAWVVQGYAAARLRPLLQLAQARERRERAQREALDDLTHRYEERKLLDRAKGILMQARQIPEDEAFKLLRQAAMQAKQRVGQVAQQVIDAARDADAVNRAGQLRMLSQRMVKLQALMAAGTDAAAARALLLQSLDRGRQLLAHLQRSISGPTFGDLLAGVAEAFGALESALSLPDVASRLAAVDALAEALLRQADRLTTTLESAGPGAGLRIINLSGRQRMLVQRLAKQALLGALLPGEQGAASAAQAALTAQAFEVALAQLNEAPLAAPDIRAALASVDSEWRSLLQGVRAAGTEEGRMQLAQASEALLACFDDLTQRYERSMQLLMG